MAAQSQRLILCSAALMALVWFGTACSESTPRPFDANSYREILSAHSGRPFLLLFWSTDCGSCREELTTFGQLRRQGARFDLVLVATDDIVNAGAIASVLKETGLSDAEAWAFADPVPERIRFSIDRQWYGEVPRSYLFDARGARTAHTGPLNSSMLTQWLDSTQGH